MVEALGVQFPQPVAQAKALAKADPYAVPEGDLPELLKFVEQLLAIQPKTVEADAEHRAKFRPALRMAAEEILKLEKDPTSEPHRAATFILLSDRAWRIAQFEPPQQRKIVADLKDFLSGAPSLGAELAMTTAKTLEQMGEFEQAIDAYTQFAAALTQSSDAKIGETKAAMEKAALRLKELRPQFPAQATLEVAPKGTLMPVDLQAVGNRTLRDSIPGAAYPGNGMAELPAGEHKLGGATFWIGPTGLQLAGTRQPPTAPQKIEVPVGRHAARLYVLHATMWGYNAAKNADESANVKDGTRIGEYRVCYEDGSAASMPIAYGEDVRDWWTSDGGRPVTRSKVVWTGSNYATNRWNKGALLRLYLGVWENPHPEKKLARIEYSSTMDTVCAPFCVAITLEEPAPKEGK